MALGASGVEMICRDMGAGYRYPAGVAADARRVRSHPQRLVRGPSGLAALLVPAAALAQGSIAGVVKLGGPAPPRAPYKVSKDATVCGTDQPNEAVVVSAAGTLANVVVSLRVPRPATTPPPTPNA